MLRHYRHRNAQTSRSIVLSHSQKTLTENGTCPCICVRSQSSVSFTYPYELDIRRHRLEFEITRHWPPALLHPRPLGPSRNKLTYPSTFQYTGQPAYNILVPSSHFAFDNGPESSEDKDMVECHGIGVGTSGRRICDLNS
ncbi:hypothetical protein PILCRDRAFT_669365 [Piloderma croceum F 1598]|uniref:Uncharacterized protein n=1 Tax=Piloderma croceum (strain F 1598) TaxID=765440 RepID=A0A0C3F6G5_PILCF|nr:hypothetical protein PILCRDRAFT_669365 [Piloderma croceum F 1598]